MGRLERERQEDAMDARQDSFGNGKDRLVGTILRTVLDRGFGFIQCEGRDYFFHATSLTNCELGQIQPGSTASFTPTKGPKGLRAEQVLVSLEGR